MFSGLGLAPLVLIFAGAAGVVWFAGVWLSRSTDVLDTSLGLGEALGGAILLALATNLPEIAITSSAAVSHDLGIAIGNILGGIAIQTVVLVVLDIAVGREAALTTRAASLILGLEGLLVMLVLSITIMGAQLPGDALFARTEPAALLIVIAWITGLWLVNRARRGLPWHDVTGTAPGAQAEPMGHSKQKKAEKMGLSRAVLIFGGGAAVTLAAGIVLEQSGGEIADHLGLSGVVFGATILAAATALPEVSTGIESIRLGDYQLAVSDIFGGIYRPEGLDLGAVRSWVDAHGSLADYPDARHVSNSELLELPCDILVLAALEEQLTSENAPRVRVTGAGMMSYAVGRAVITSLGYARLRSYTIHLWI